MKYADMAAFHFRYKGIVIDGPAAALHGCAYPLSGSGLFRRYVELVQGDFIACKMDVPGQIAR